MTVRHGAAALALVAGSLGLAACGGPGGRGSDPRPAPPDGGVDRTTFPIGDPSSPWVVVDKARPLDPLDYAPSDLVPVGNGASMRAPAAAALRRLQAAARTAGHALAAYSGYRSYAYQGTVYASEVAAQGQAAADRASARPGYSEHQTGWVADVGDPTVAGCIITACFGDTPSGQWTAANCWRYGFIVRYRQGDEHITGYKDEPWHLRYVGVPLAAELRRTGIRTLEEFFGLPAAPTYTTPTRPPASPAGAPGAGGVPE